MVFLSSPRCAKQQPQSAEVRLVATPSDRLMARYQELRSGRFAVIADFEDPAQVELFQMASALPIPGSRPRLETRKDDPGGTDMVVTFSNPSDQLLANNDRPSNWYMKRDWRDYDLLLIGVTMPQAGEAAGSRLNRCEISLRVGPSSASKQVSTEEPLRPGRNLLSIDLNELKDRLALDDVREIGLRMLESAQPVTVRFDDFLLTSNREAVFGDPANTNGELYVQRAGRGWKIGSGGRFELGLFSGQFTQWHDPATDPGRFRNLLKGASLEPAVIDDARPFSDGENERWAAHVEIKEINTLRVMVNVNWRSTDRSTPSKAEHQCTYAIYSTGQVFFSKSGWNATYQDDPVLIRLLGALEPNERLQVQFADALHPREQERAWFGVRRLESNDAALLFMPTLGMDLKILPNPKGESPSSWMAMNVPSLEVPLMCQYYFSRSSTLDDREAQQRALAYACPEAPLLQAGIYGGFDAATGCHQLVPEDGKVSMLLDGRTRPWFDPMFRIRADGASNRIWVYVNDRLHKPLFTDSEGQVFFQLPGTVRDRRRVEILLAP